MYRRSNILVALILAGCAAALGGLSGSYILPLDHEAIQYAKLPVTDPIIKLEERIARGEVKLTFDAQHGYLVSVLEALGIAKESQVLVFSKTSFQAPRIAPRLPRAIYYNDNVSIGIVRGGDVLEIASLDPKQGVIFYTLDQEQVSKPRFDRRDTCLQCHATGATLGVPGIVVRSIYPEPSGMPLFHAGGFISDHRSPLKDRWGGWYVTGTHGSETHMGNSVVRNRETPDKLETEGNLNLTDLASRFDTGAYLTPHSDIVALMVLEHQTHMTNLITRVGFEARMALYQQAGINQALKRPAGEMSESTRRRIDNAVEEMLDYMLFLEEAPLGSTVKGTSGFERVFANQGPRDSRGRSLRELEVDTRLFRYPLSYMIYTEAFDEMPVIARERLLRRLWEVLTGHDNNARFTRLTAEDRKAILEILRDTKKNLPAYWTDQD